MKKIRLRMVTGRDTNGEPIIRRLCAASETELADAIIAAAVETGRIKDFLPAGAPSETPAEAPAERPKHPFDAYIDHWITVYKTGLAATTAVFYASKRSVLVRHFGATPIEDIDVEAVQGFVAARAAEYSHSTVKADLGVLRDLLDAAVQDGILTKNPAYDKRIKNTAPRGKGTTAFTAEQAADIQANIPGLADPVQRCLLALLAYTSMCREELLGLKWESVDLDNDIITIDAAVVYAGGTVRKGTKNEFRTRQLPICPALHDTLAGCRRDAGYVVHGPDPWAPISSYYYRRLWKDMAGKINLYGLSARSFRTTFATMATAAGVDAKTVATMMGHSNTNTAMIHYVKPEAHALSGAMDKISGYVAASNSASKSG